MRNEREREKESERERERERERESQRYLFMPSFTPAYRSLWVIKAPGEKADNLGPD